MVVEAVCDGDQHLQREILVPYHGGVGVERSEARGAGAKWTPEDRNGYGPELLTALEQQLGLKLESGKASVESLVVDHAERLPVGN